MKEFLQVVREGFSEEALLESGPDRAGVQNPEVHANWTIHAHTWRTGENHTEIHPLGRSESGRALGQHVEEGPAGPGGDGPQGSRPRGPPGPGGCGKPWWPWQLARAGSAPAGGRQWQVGPWLPHYWGYFWFYFYFLMFLVCSEICILCSMSHFLNLATYWNIFRVPCRPARPICCLEQLVDTGVWALVQPLPFNVREQWYFRLPRL